MELGLSLKIPGSRENPFNRLPELLKLRIFARLDAKALVSASAVCKDWNAFLNNSAVRSLTLNPNLSGASSCFLLKICYRAGDSDLDLRHGYVTVEHDGGCGAVEVLNNIVDEFRGWDVSCNGVLFSFPKWVYPDAITPPIVVCHPSLKWIKTVHLPPDASIPHNYLHNGFWGASFDPSTCHFILLIGIASSPCQVLIYTSQTSKWTSRVYGRNHRMDRNPVYAQGNGIFSQGCFFWLDKHHSERWDKGLLIFDTLRKGFRIMPLPQCSAHPNIGTQCYRPMRFGLSAAPYGWELRGCDGALVLVHYKSPSPRNEVVVAWRLDQNGSTWKWDVVLHRPQLIHCPYKPWFDMDKSGWWLWAEKVDFRNREDLQDLIILGEDGQEQHSIPMSLLASRLGLPPNSYPHVDGLWVLQTITLWDSLAAL